MLLAALLLVGIWQVRQSQAILSGKIFVAGAERPIVIERDDWGVPTISAQTRNDVALATGFLHAQDRFFQMDLLRRVSSGRLSELVGKAALDADRSMRVHRFQATAQAICQRLDSEACSLMEAYAAGVNQGLQKLGSRPPEYWVLQQRPEPWQPSDCILVMLTMMCDLQDEAGSRKRAWGEFSEKVPREVFDFLVRVGSQWDAPIDASVIPAVAVPGPEVWSLRESSRAASAANPSHRDSSGANELLPGSNNWGVTGDLVRGGAGMLASDMHLGLNVPATWYRLFIKEPVWIVGATLPGTPLVICGSNRSVAWGFTNSYGDFGDVVELKNDPARPDHYLTPEGSEPVVRYEEKIRFPGGEMPFAYAWSRWGPIQEEQGRRFAHHWVGHDPAAFDVNLWRFESARSVTEVLDWACRAGMPHNNVVAVDAEGRVGWTVCGRIPKRRQPCSILPVDWSQAESGWEGYLAPEEYPRREWARDGRIWTANNRIVGGQELEILGSLGYDIGARARQIRDRLNEKDRFEEADFLAIQRDCEARFLSGWRDRLLALHVGGKGPLSDEALGFVTNWGGAASVDSVGYRIVARFRDVAHELFRSAIQERSGAKLGPLLSLEDVLTQLLEEQPIHWLPAAYATWEDFLADAAERVEGELRRQVSLREATWGARNRAAISHPMSRAVPWLGPWLDMPSLPLPGDRHMPLVQGPAFGASMRMVVTPGEEERGIYHQPGGASGHFLSPFYRAGFDDWAAGHPSSLLPGPARHRLELWPER